MPIITVVFVNDAHLSKKCRNYASIIFFTLNLVKTLTQLYATIKKMLSIFTLFTTRNFTFTSA